MTSKHFAVVGDPIEHSLSPRIHVAAYKFLSLDWDYKKNQVPKGTLKDFLLGQGIQLSGLSVTMPLKLEAAALASSRDEIVELLGVANTLVREKGNFSAFNTDVFGIEMALAKAWESSIEHVAILGSGATAQSALFALSRKTPSAKVFIYVRDASKTQPIRQLAAELDMDLVVRELNSYSTDQQLTINTVPAVALEVLDLNAQNGWLLNVNYASKEPNLSSQFNSEKVVNGETMLIWQAIAQIRIFLFGTPDIQIENEEDLFANMAAAI